ncbi:MAG TPA: FAD-binding protein, partial [Thermoanaerobaculia bacterium]|nr:FAD-binding protein [Thermoanaerobaculia bacterium]
MTADDVQALVAAAIETQSRLLPRGGGTKTALSTPADGGAILDLSGLSGVLEYQPEEYTFTALAGTRVKDVAALLAEKGQYLPFDPLLAERGATLGGSVAAGANGPGRQRYGGVRDFLIAARFVD